MIVGILGLFWANSLNNVYSALGSNIELISTSDMYQNII